MTSPHHMRHMQKWLFLSLLPHLHQLRRDFMIHLLKRLFLSMKLQLKNCARKQRKAKKMIRVRKFVLKKKVGLYLFPLCLTQPCHLQPDLHTQFIILPQPRKRHFLHLLRLPPQNRHHRPIAYHHVHQSHHVMR